MAAWSSVKNIVVKSKDYNKYLLLYVALKSNMKLLYKVQNYYMKVVHAYFGNKYFKCNSVSSCKASKSTLLLIAEL